MKTNEKMPTARVCDFLSLATAAGGVAAALVYFLPRPVSAHTVMLSFLILLGFFVAAVLVRMLGIIGQNLFNLNRKMGSLEETLIIHMRDLRKDADDNAHGVRGILDQVNCDTRDMNENIREIKNFFEQIEKHLNLKK